MAVTLVRFRGKQAGSSFSGELFSAFFVHVVGAVKLALNASLVRPSQELCQQVPAPAGREREVNLGGDSAALISQEAQGLAGRQRELFLRVGCPCSEASSKRATGVDWVGDNAFQQQLLHNLHEGPRDARYRFDAANTQVKEAWQARVPTGNVRVFGRELEGSEH